MMEIQKALNQNAVLVLDEGQAKVAIGKGIGFKQDQVKQLRKTQLNAYLSWNLRVLRGCKHY